MRRVTALNSALSDWDEGFLPDGRQKTFSVGFVTKRGVYIYIHRAVRSGLRANMKGNSLKAVIAVDADNNAIGHVYPVWIHSILFYRGNIIYNLFDGS